MLAAFANGGDRTVPPNSCVEGQRHRHKFHQTLKRFRISYDSQALISAPRRCYSLDGMERSQKKAFDDLAGKNTEMIKTEAKNPHIAITLMIKTCSSLI